MSTTLADAAREADALVAQGRAQLVAAVRQAAASGMTQTEIAAQIGRSQPEVSRLLRFHGRSPLAMRLRRNASEVKNLIAAEGGRNVRVFGSLATGQDHAESDVDLLVTLGRPLSMMQLTALEQALGELLGASVDVVPDTLVRPEFSHRIGGEAVTL